MSSKGNKRKTSAEKFESGQIVDQAREFLNRVTDVAPTMLYIYDLLERRNVWVNRDIVENLGYLPDELKDLGADFLQKLMHPEDAARYPAHYQRLRHLQTNEIAEFEFRMPHKDGAWRWLFSREMAFVFAPDGTVSQIVGAATDITEHKLSESRLTLLSEISELARKYEDPDKLLFAVSVAVGEHFEVKRCLFNEIDLEKDIETVHRDYCQNGVESVAGKHKITNYSSISTAEMISGKIVVNNDSKIDPRTSKVYKKTYEPNGERAYVAVPLMRENRWVASLWLSDDKPRKWSAAEIFLLETIAERVWSIIEKLRIDAALRKSEQRYRALIEAAGQVVWTMETGNEENPQPPWFSQLTDNSNDETQNYLDFIHPEDRDYLQTIWKSVSEKPAPYEVEFRLAPKNEEYRYYNLRGVPLLNEDGSLREWIGTVQDITERKSAEEKLRRSENQMRVVTDAMPALISYIDTEFRYRFINQTYTDWFGYSGAEVIGKTMPEVLGAEAFEVLRPHVESAFKGRTEFFETETPYKDGGTRFIRGTYTPDFAFDGKVRGIFVLVLDITMEKAAELALRESEESYRILTNTASDAIIRINNQSIIEFVNSAVERVFGYKPYEILGKPLTILMPEELRPSHHAGISRYMQTGERHLNWASIEVTAQHKDGRQFPLEISFGEHNNSEKRFFIGIARDITQRKQAETEREQLLLNEKLLRHQAEEASRLKDEFLATVSHELRTPLNAILGWATMVRKNNYDAATMRRAFEIIERSARNQNQLISDILDVSRIITGKLLLVLSPVSLSSIIHAAIDTVRPAIDAKNITLQLNLGEDPQIILGDADRLQQIFWNLLSNAAKFTNEGGKIEVYARRNEGFAEVSITDNGSGIEPEFLPYAFDRFRQADGKTTRKHGGLGLGLAIARNLVELHGGIISVESEGLDRGTVFTVRLPFNQQLSDHQSFNNDAQFLSQNTPQKLLSDKKILVVDDEPDAIELVSFILTDHGATIFKAESVDAALKIFDAKKPDIVISDIGMPEKDGYDLIRELKTRKNGQTPSVALTAYASEADNKSAIEAGFTAYLPKPLEPTALIDIIVRLTA